MEDIEFAKLMKRKGYRVYFVFAEEFIKTRMYQRFSQIWEGFSKNMTQIMRNTGFTRSLYVTIKSFLLGWGPILVPIFAFYALSNWFTDVSETQYYGTLGLAVLPTFLMVLFSIMIAREFRIPLFYGPLFTFGYTMHGILNLLSYFKTKKGYRTWKGRTYPAS